MAKRDYYELLDVARDASPEDLKKAYRRLAKQYHPDRNPGDASAEGKFKELSEAYEVLRDEQRRAAYDQFGHAAFEGGGGAGAGFSAASFANVFDDLFGEFMGRSRGTQAGRQGADLRYNLEISLEDAFRGKQASLRTTTAVNCEPCGGSGAKAGSRPSNCPSCRGSGRVRAQQGFFTIERTCPSCQGAGKVIEDPCPSCRGTGRVAKERSLSVNIPHGVEDGMRIRLAGEGEAGTRGGPPGDLYIFVSVAPHRLFKRDGQSLFCRVPVAMTGAALGCQIDVPTLDGKRARLTVPEGTQSGHQFRLRAKGMPSLQGDGVGDLFVQTVIETPVNLTPRQKELLREFEAVGGEETSPEAAGFFARVKEFWNDLT